jgi:PAS domain S-box-containing protein
LISSDNTHDGGLVELQGQPSVHSSQDVAYLQQLQAFSSNQAAWQAALLQAAHDAFIVLNAEQRIFFWNHGAERLYGWSEQEALGQEAYRLLKTQFPVPLAEILRVLHEQKYWEGELEHTRKDGTPLVVASRWTLLEQDGSSSPMILEVNRDITDLKRTLIHLSFLTEASRLLVSSFDYKEALIQIAHRAVPIIADWCRVDLLREDGTPYPHVITHVDPTKVAWAYRLNQQASYNPDAPAGLAAVLRNKRAEFYPFISDELLTAAARNEQELALLRGLGFSSVIIVPLVVQGESIGAITFVTTETKRHFTPTDLAMVEELSGRIAQTVEKERIYWRLQELNNTLETQVEQRTQELLQLNKELKRSNQELEEFAYVASHDLQEPLRKIQAFGNLLEEEFGQALGEGKFYLDRMRNAASRMQVLINDLLTFSRVTTKTLPFTAVNLTIIAHEVVSDLEARIQETGGTVEINDLPIIDADPLQMRQMLQNLIGNALKFHRPDELPLVTLSAQYSTNPQTEEPQCTLFVQDNGIGFDEKYLDRIFTVFQRLHGRSQYEGTGIGLAVVRKIVARHGGSITARSTPGQGSTFIITLPIHHATGEGSIL